MSQRNTPATPSFSTQVSLATNKCSFPKNRFQPKVVSIFHTPRRWGEPLAQRAEEITGLSAGQHHSAALSFRQDKMEVKDGYGAVNVDVRMRQLPHRGKHTDTPAISSYHVHTPCTYSHHTHVPHTAHIYTPHPTPGIHNGEGQMNLHFSVHWWEKWASWHPGGMSEPALTLCRCNSLPAGHPAQQSDNWLPPPLITEIAWRGGSGPPFPQLHSPQGLSRAISNELSV